MKRKDCERGWELSNRKIMNLGSRWKHKRHIICHTSHSLHCQKMSYCVPFGLQSTPSSASSLPFPPSTHPFHHLSVLSLIIQSPQMWASKHPWQIAESNYGHVSHLRGSEFLHHQSNIFHTECDFSYACALLGMKLRLWVTLYFH